jgi:hypothetical protein
LSQAEPVQSPGFKFVNSTISELVRVPEPVQPAGFEFMGSSLGMKCADFRDSARRLAPAKRPVRGRQPGPARGQGPRMVAGRGAGGAGNQGLSFS